MTDDRGRGWADGSDSGAGDGEQRCRIGTGTLATFISRGGLGQLITTGIHVSLNSLVCSGAVLVALLALAIDWVGRVMEHVARPKGL